jgi:hypothetical protein
MRNIIQPCPLCFLSLCADTHLHRLKRRLIQCCYTTTLPIVRYSPGPFIRHWNRQQVPDRLAESQDVVNVPDINYSYYSTAPPPLYSVVNPCSHII